MEEDFTGDAIHDQPTRRQWSIDPPFDARVRQLVRDWDARESPELIEEMIVTALKIARDHMSIADLKLINRSVKEMRNAAKIFAPFQHLRKVAIFGSARTPPDSPVYEVAKDFAHQMVLHNFMMVTGGGDGIMGAAQRGAGRAHSFGLNIRLPSEQRANEIIEGDPKLITLNYFFTRKLNFVKEAHAFALFPGGFGTLDEAFEVLTLMQTGKARIIPVVLLNRPRGNYWEQWMKFITNRLFRRGLISKEDFSFFKTTHDVPEAVARLKQQRDRNLLLYGSGALLNTLLEHDLIDQYRIMIHPVVLGQGKRLFREASEEKPLRLVDVSTTSTGVMIADYEPEPILL